MLKFCLRLHSAAIVTLLTFGAACASTSAFNTTANETSAASGIRSIGLGESASPCPEVAPLPKAIDKAHNAATVAQLAQSKPQWEAVVSQGLEAIASIQAIPPETPRGAFAQTKVAEYLQNLEIAPQKATITTAQLPFPSFDNPILDEQLRLYLSYIASVGKPDVLIVGSSRALVGVDPRQLQQALVAQGKGSLKIFNFAVNGATAQLIDFQLRQLLTPDQLPRLIIWADGVRAFNSARVDRTYNSLVASQGYKRLMVGDRPRLSQAQPDTIDGCEVIPDPSISSAIPETLNALASSASSNNTSERLLTRVSYKSASKSVPSSDDALLLTPLTDRLMAQWLIPGLNTTGYSTSAIDANGFLSLDSRFDPNIYYKRNPRVAGGYDLDYQPFSLAGQQTVALNSIKALAMQLQIPLVFVNLPLTQDYLDTVRQSREEQFQQFMQQQVSPGFVFIDLDRQWLNQNQYFTDPSHLNRYGAAAISSQLATNRQISWPQGRP